MRHMPSAVTLLLNTDYWLSRWIGEVWKLPRPVLRFATDAVESFFICLNQIFSQGRLRALEDRREIKEEIVSLMVADLEGLGPGPKEFSVEEVDLLVKLTCFLYDDFLTAVDADCLCQGIALHFKRFVGDDLLICYQHDHRTFRAASPKQRSLLTFDTDLNDEPERPCL